MPNAVGVRPATRSIDAIPGTVYRMWWILLLIAAGCATMPDTPIVSNPPSVQAIPPLQGSYHIVRRGETLWRIAHGYGLDVQTLTSANRLPSAHQVSVGQQLFIPLPPESQQFLWPIRGSVRTPGAWIEITTQRGTLIRASRSGQVAVATRQLAGLGKTVILDHHDGYMSVYAGMDQLLVTPNTHLRQGMPVGSMGEHPLHFEIRYEAKPKNVLALLPRE